jgi:hypothetical protein
MSTLLQLLVIKATAKKKGEGAFDKLVKFTCTLMPLFPFTVQLAALDNFAKELNGIGFSPTDPSTSAVFVAKDHSEKDIRSYKFAAFTFLQSILSSDDFSKQAQRFINTNSHEAMEAVFLPLIEHVLTQSQQVVDHIAATDDKLYKAHLKLVHNILNKLTSMLTLGTFVRIVSTLLKHSNAMIQRKSMDMLNTKLERLGEYEGQYMDLVDTLVELITTPTPAVDKERIIVKQAAFASLALMVKTFGTPHAAAFTRLVDMLIGPHGLGHAHVGIVTSSIVTLAVFVKHLGPRMLVHLSTFMPAVFTKMQQETDALLQHSILSLWDSLVQHMPAFLNPYLEQLLTLVLHPSLLDTDKKNDRIRTQTLLVLQHIAQHVPCRLLLDPITRVFPLALGHGTVSTTAYLDMLHSMLQVITRTDMEALHKPFFHTFLQVFSQYLQHTQHDTVTETKLTECFLGLVIKLNEITFKPLFFLLIEWATRPHEHNHRLFYKIIGALCDGLTSIFTPYYAHVMDTTLTRLAALKENMDVDEWTAIVTSLYKCLLYDTDGYWNRNLKLSERLFAPLVDQIEAKHDASNEAFLDRVQNVLAPCIGQLASSVSHDTYWKELNKHVLVKTRSDVAVVRMAALHVEMNVWQRLGSELLIHLPETVPFLAELLEDNDPMVEKMTQGVIQEIESHLGESMDKYFN